MSFRISYTILDLLGANYAMYMDPCQGQWEGGNIGEGALAVEEGLVGRAPDKFKPFKPYLKTIQILADNLG